MGSLKKIRHTVKHAVKKMLKRLHKKLVQKVGKHTAKHIMKQVKRSAARHAVIAVHKVIVHVKHHENEALAKLRAVGRKVAEQITKEDIRAHKSRQVSEKQGTLAGVAAVKFAAALIRKQLVKHIGAARAGRMIKRCIKMANRHVKHAANRTAHKGHHHHHHAKRHHHGKKHHHAKHGKKHSHHAKHHHSKKHSHHGKKLVQVANKAAVATTAKAKMANVLAKMQA